MDTDIEDQTLIDIQLAEQALELQKRRLRWTESKTLLTPIVRTLVKLDIEPTLNGDYLGISFAGDSAKLKTVLGLLLEAGFTTTAEQPKPGATQWIAFFRTSGSPIEIYFNFTSSVCVRKKIGTKMVEQDVYEVICGDCTTESMQLPPPAPVLDELVF